MTEIIMPKLSDTMTEGRFGAWKRSVGDRIERGEVIAEVETDKAVMELEAYADGILLETRARAGELVPVGTVIGVIGAEGELSVIHPASQLPPAASPVAPAIMPPVPPERLPEPHLPGPPEVRHEGRAAPAVRRRAHELGIDLTLITGSGPGGRVLMEDLEHAGRVFAAPATVTMAATVAGAENLSPAAATSVPPDAGAPLSRMRAAIARTVADSWSTIPHFTVEVEVAMEAAGEVRRELQQGGTLLSPTDLILKAVSLALRDHPRVNSSFAGDRIIGHDDVNIGLAVALPDGLQVPVVRGADHLTIHGLAAERRRLIAAAHGGTLREAELAGGTFTVSNLGMYGVPRFTAVILPPQAAILAVGAVRDAVVPRSGAAVIALLMTLTLSADHRILDGAYAAEFMMKVRHYLENPVLLLV